MAENYDVVVVGAGIEGSATAYNCVKNDLRTLLLEQFPLPHTRGSSHGAGRATHYSYAEQHYAKMMQEAFPLWTVLEKETNTILYRKTGMLVVSNKPRDSYGTILDHVKNYGKSVEELSVEERKRRYPGFRHSDDAHTYIDLQAGVLSADKALRCFQDEFVKRGGVLRDGEKMLEIIPGTIATVRTNQGEYKARSVVLTPGPWASKVLNPLGLQPPLTTWRINVMYWQEKVPGTYKNFPIFVDVGEGTRHIYGLPIQEYPGMMKINYHGGIDPVDPDQRDTLLTKHQWDIDHVSRYVREHFPGLHDRPVIVQTCMYTCTPDNEIILDRHPVHPNIVIGCGFSGRGFKLSPVVGKILCQLAMGQSPSHDISPCSLKRFPNSSLTGAKL